MDSLAELAFLLSSCVTDLNYLATDIAAQQAFKGRWKLPVGTVLGTSEIKDSISLKLRLALSKSCSFVQERKELMF